MGIPVSGSSLWRPRHHASTGVSGLFLPDWGRWEASWKSYTHHPSHQPVLSSPSLPPTLLGHASRYITPRFQAIFTAIGNLHRSCWMPYRMEPAVSSTTDAASCLEGHNRLLLLLIRRPHWRLRGPPESGSPEHGGTLYVWMGVLVSVDLMFLCESRVCGVERLRGEWTSRPPTSRGFREIPSPS